MDNPLSRRRFVQTSAIVSAGLPFAASGRVPALAAAQDATPTSGTMNTGTLETRIGPLHYTVGYPADETSQRLYDEMDFQRACQAYIWAIPAMGFQALRKAQRESLGTPDGAMCTYLDFDDKIGMLTPNVTTAYGFVFWNMAAQGPLVIEVPPLPTAGGVGDIWQRPVTDTGQTGPDGAHGATTSSVASVPTRSAGVGKSCASM